MRARDRRILQIAGIVAGTIVIATAVALALTPVDPDPTADGHGWRGEYYRDLLFLGEPMARREPQLRFDWARSSPFPERRPTDRFSVRWDACIDIPQDTTLAITLTSDDGSRAFVDGELVTDNWGDHGMRAVDGRTPVTRGSHHLLIEYYEMARDARLVVDLAHDGGPVPREWLRIPSRPHAAPDVCAR